MVLPLECVSSNESEFRVQTKQEGGDINCLLIFFCSQGISNGRPSLSVGKRWYIVKIASSEDVYKVTSLPPRLCGVQSEHCLHFGAIFATSRLDSRCARVFSVCFVSVFYFQRTVKGKTYLCSCKQIHHALQETVTHALVFKICLLVCATSYLFLFFEFTRSRQEISLYRA